MEEAVSVGFYEGDAFYVDARFRYLERLTDEQRRAVAGFLSRYLGGSGIDVSCVFTVEEYVEYLRGLVEEAGCPDFVASFVDFRKMVESQVVNGELYSFYLIVDGWYAEVVVSVDGLY